MNDQYPETDARVSATRGSASGARPRAQLDSPTSLGDLNARARMLVDRMGDLAFRAEGVGDRTYGEGPKGLNQRGAEELSESPPYGGAMAEMFYCLAQMDERLRRAELAVSRIESLA